MPIKRPLDRINMIGNLPSGKTRRSYPNDPRPEDRETEDAELEWQFLLEQKLRAEKDKKARRMFPSSKR